MAKSDTVKALARVLIGLAWEDGTVTTAELRLLKDVMFRIPELTADDWDDLEIYWMTPIRKAEMQALSQEFLSALQTEQDREYAKRILMDMAHVDGEITNGEAGILHSLKRSIDNIETKMVDEMGQLMETVLQKRTQMVNGQTDYMDKFVENGVYDLMRIRFGGNLERKLDLDRQEIRKLALAGALMGRVAYADKNISDNELEAMNRILQRDWNLREEYAAIVTECAAEAVVHLPDLYRLSREFYESTMRQERADFIEVLFDVAFASEGVVSQEDREIRNITRVLKLTEEEFQIARDHAAFMNSRR
ncbi:MAG: TerB family tellurite resistance protein [Anaerolineae bacterium]|nr:TerB family tellurite resistance protein [Anaerolineae bacterium]